MQVYEYENTGTNSLDLDGGRERARFSVLYTRYSTRKHKKWEGDGVLICYENLALLKSEDERDVISRSTSVKRVDDLEDGREFRMGGWEVQIQNRISSPYSNESKSSIQEASNPVPATKRCPSFSPSFTPPQHKVPFIVNEDEVEKNGEQAVVADPLVSRYLRDHQKDGVRFMFSRLRERKGVILADEMGLGKSIQAIVTAMALMKQSKTLTENTVKKCLVVVPSSLVNNWKSEFAKWFKTGRIPVITVKCPSDVVCYSSSYSTYPFLVISYELALSYVEKLIPIRFDLLICDEGHRLKNINGKLRSALDSLTIPRRLLLTGTPIQNDIEELFSLLDFVRPTQFGSISHFKALQKKEDGELDALIEDCLLRRTAEVNNSHLPMKNNYVLFCAASPLQRRVLTAIADHIQGDPLATRVGYSSLLFSYPKDFGSAAVRIEDSGKLSVFVEMMTAFQQLGECTVVVSNSTKTLDMLSALCTSLGLHVLRLDGSTPVVDRQKLVNHFNTTKDPKNVFLLSTKAGGVGLNLIGASRLVLFDSDWNPALDQQAMARIWRDGQTRPCHIYRLVTAGTIDEKMLHRQIKKNGLTSIINFNDQSFRPTFVDEELESIFTVCRSECEIHDLLGCSCDGTGLLPNEAEDEPDESSDDDYSTSDKVEVEDDPIKSTDTVIDESVPNEEDVSASMAELFRWRHYSPRHEDTWEFFKAVAGFKNFATTDLTFAFHLEGKF
ncbi:hypothetical protein Q1695_006689 [Nippostrongylus brasiliensis]|nr:hypothetical protein Q1695_006689 [Nippostrongylus brasiliensis]